MNTNAGKKKPRSKERLQGIMVYIPIDLNVRLSKYAEDWRISKSRIVRDGIESRIIGVGESPYVAGFNQGLEEAVKICKEVSLLKMMYPSGTPVWKHLEEQINAIRKSSVEVK